MRRHFSFSMLILKLLLGTAIGGFVGGTIACIETLLIWPYFATHINWDALGPGALVIFLQNIIFYAVRGSVCGVIIAWPLAQRVEGFHAFIMGLLHIAGIVLAVLLGAILFFYANRYA